MILKFTKMHGTGNDFIVLDGVRQQFQLEPEQLRLLADRHFGVGCDQILIVEDAQHPDADFRYRIYNADGGEVEQCGNGARCFVRFVHNHGLTNKREIVVETKSGLITPRLEENGQVTVMMGAPIFDTERIPFIGNDDEIIQTLEVNGKEIQITALSMGNPHAVQIVTDIEHAPVAIEGKLIEQHPRFPKRVNAGFMQIMDRTHIKLRVYERGAGETLSCGTGACAAVVTGIRRGLLDTRVNVATHGGVLSIIWEGPSEPVWMTGPAITVFEGEINL
ncbi:diaminopimelate epimerase [Candidatus Nitrotoga fabula]|uniref:Diaminopimelate epimerase n=1 Tax=Candidatus Nitrotoga fabula TaxID=2182327 RepID=A0A916FAA4_9PROT|nr:diaminopimelate epimerase [Candidatus Nitrotoga fabula]CAE6694099.1 diaminopimelate epimerase [Candidatus Nitrotoga fabula]